MGDGALLISGNFPSYPINFFAENLNLRSYNMIKGSTGRRRLSCWGSSVMNSSERSRPTRKNRSVSRESMELGRSSNDDQLPVMKQFRKFVTSAGILVECTHLGCKPVFDEEDSTAKVPHECLSLEKIIGDPLLTEYAVCGWKLRVADFAEKGGELITGQTGVAEAVEVAGMYASFLWTTEEGNIDQ